MKTQLVIEIESQNVRKIAHDEPDLEGEQVIDEKESQQFEQAIHRNIGIAIAGFVDDADKLDAEVIEQLEGKGYDMETMLADPVTSNLQELGNITIKVLWHKAAEFQRPEAKAK